MLALTIKHPYIDQVLDGSKTIETRKFRFLGVLNQKVLFISPVSDSIQTQITVQITDIRKLQEQDFEQTKLDSKDNLLDLYGYWFKILDVKQVKDNKIVGKLGFFNINYA